MAIENRVVAVKSKLIICGDYYGGRTLKIVIIDGQGGRMGQMLVEELKRALPEHELIAIGTNSVATTAMLRAGADCGATGENPVVFNCSDADIIIGPLGIVVANSLLGEVTPQMAIAVGQSRGQKILIPLNKCNNTVVGIQELPYNEYITLAVEEVKRFVEG